jgi:hypothetical protein
VIPAGRSHHAGWRDLPQKEIGEGAPRLERPRVLQQLQLENDPAPGQTASEPLSSITGVWRICPRMTDSVAVIVWRSTDSVAVFAMGCLGREQLTNI